MREQYERHGLSHITNLEVDAGTGRRLPQGCSRLTSAAQRYHGHYQLNISAWAEDPIT